MLALRESALFQRVFSSNVCGELLCGVLPGTPPKRAALQHPSVSDCTEVHADAASDSTSNPSRAGTRDGGASAAGGPDLPGPGADYGRVAGDARRTETSGVGSSSDGGPGDSVAGSIVLPAHPAAEVSIASSDAAAARDADGGGATPPISDGRRAEAGGSADLAAKLESAAQANGAPGVMRVLLLGTRLVLQSRFANVCCIAELLRSARADYRCKLAQGCLRKCISNILCL